jgi:hypothetical protein
VNTSGNVNFDPKSHRDKDVFRSPLESGEIISWQFKFPGPITLLHSVYPEYLDNSTGIIVYPSFLRDLGITDAGNDFVISDYYSVMGMGMEETEIGFEKIESFSDKLFSVVSFFMESGADARGYHFKKNDLITVDQHADTISTQRRFISNDLGYRDPCSDESYRAIDSTLFEVRYQPSKYEVKEQQHIRQTAFRYYHVDADGKINVLESNREFPFTQFVKIDESYFTVCNFDYIEYADDNSPNYERPNVIVTKSLSNEELDIMRNEIFASYGFKFKSEKWKNYFEGKSWYKPQHDDVNHLLNEIDRYNAKFILEYQKKNKNLKVEQDSITYYAVG